MNKKLLFILLVVGLLMATALPAFASGFSFSHPVHGPGDLVPPKHATYGNHPTGCFPPLVLNRYGQCALPGMDTHPDPLPGRRGF